MSYRPQNTKERILHRLKIVQGHIKKIQSMVENDAYCIDIINQSRAVQSSLKEIDNLVLEAHLNGCVVNAIEDGQKTKAVSEIMSIFKTYK